MASCQVCSRSLRRAATGRPASYCGPMCKDAAKRWRQWANAARELRASAAASTDAGLVAALLVRAAGFDESVAYQRRMAANGWALAEDYVNQLNAMCNEMTDE